MSAVTPESFTPDPTFDSFVDAAIIPTLVEEYLALTARPETELSSVVLEEAA